MTLLATTGPKAVATAGFAALQDGGSAVDAIVASALAWPPALLSGGMCVGRGPGLGSLCCLFPGRMPGLGLSRPRRSELLKGGSPQSYVAAPSFVPAIAAVLTRWGNMTFSQVVACARSSEKLAHDVALDMLQEGGPKGALKGELAVAVAKALGPVGGGLLTRRDLIEARPELPEALDLETIQSFCRKGKPPEDARVLGIAAVDRGGGVAAMSLEAGTDLADLPLVAGAEPNSLLRRAPQVSSRRVGRLILLHNACGVFGKQLTAAVGRAGAVADLLTQPELLDAPQPEPTMLILRPKKGMIPPVEGAQSVLES